MRWGGVRLSHGGCGRCPALFFGARLPRQFGRCGFGGALSEAPLVSAPADLPREITLRVAEAERTCGLFSRGHDTRGVGMALGSGDVPPANGKSARRLALVASSSVQSLPPHGAIKGEV